MEGQREREVTITLIDDSLSPLILFLVHPTSRLLNVPAFKQRILTRTAPEALADPKNPYAASIQKAAH